MSLLALSSRLRSIDAQTGLLLASGSVAAFLFLKSQWTARSNVKLVPGLPILGNMVEVLCGYNDLFDVMLSWFEKMGVTTLMWRMPGMSPISTIDPKNIEHILKTRFDNYLHADTMEPFYDLFGKSSLFVVDGELWHKQRKTLVQLFTRRQFEGHIFEATASNTRRAVAILQESKGPVEMHSFLKRYTLDTISDIAFSGSINSLEDPNIAYHQALDRAQTLTVSRLFTAPWWRLMRFFRIGPEGELRRHLQTLDAEVRRMVKVLKEKLARGEVDNSVLGLFLADPALLKAVEEELGRDQDTFFRDVVMVLLVAGRDTTADCIAWALYELAQRPDLVEKIRTEIRTVCGATSPSSYAQLGQLRYLKAVLEETLRLHPSAPISVRVAVERDTLPDGTIVPAGGFVQYFIYGQCRSKQLWGEDAKLFRPERFTEMAHKPSSYVFPVFAAGPRECLGRQLAQTEMLFFLSTLLWHFDISLAVKPEEVRYEMTLTLGMNALPLHLQQRK